MEGYTKQKLVQQKDNDEIWVGMRLDRPEKVIIRVFHDGDAQEVYRRLMASNSRYCPRVFAIEETSDGFEVAEEFIAGVTLQDILDGGKLFTETELIGIACQICSALLALHSIQIIHRDINPSNVMLLADGTANLIDFDSARYYDRQKGGDTRILGTEGFAAPEQYGFLQTDPRTDIYAVGVLINVLLTGCSPKEKMCTGSLRTIVKLCTEMEPDMRYQTAKELLKALRTTPASNPSWFMRMLRTIPGFRTWKPWKMVVGTLLYWCGFRYFLMMCTPRSDATTLADTVPLAVLTTLVFLISLAIFTNWCGIFYRVFPRLRKQHIIVRVFAMIVTWFTLTTLFAGIFLLFFPMPPA